MKPRGRVLLRPAKDSDARSLHALIAANLAEGRLLPRTLGELAAHAARFVVAARGRRIVGCAELAVLSPQVAEVRSLAVDRRERGQGVGTMIVDELRRRARREGFEKLCAFTHAPAYFIQMGFSIVPHTWLLEKLTTDCVRCPLFRACGQYAMVVPIDDAQGRPLESVYDIDRAAAGPQPGAVARYA
jgi:amino-acid N-acetyltransferase